MKGVDVESVESALERVTDVYKKENFDPLKQVIGLLGQTDAETARELLVNQLSSMTEAMDHLLDELYTEIQENGRRHREVITDFENMDSCTTQVAGDLEEALRVVQRAGTLSLHGGGAGSLEQLRESIEAAPARVAGLLAANNLSEACNAVVTALKKVESEDMSRFDKLVSTKNRLNEVKNTCYAEVVRELKRLVYGCRHDQDGRWRAVSDWLEGAGAQQQLMTTLEALQALGRDEKKRAEQELMTSLRPSLHGLISLLLEKEERRQAGDPREGSAEELFTTVLDHMRRVLRLQLFVCNSLQTGDSGGFGMGLVWEGMQMELQDLLCRVLGTSANVLVGHSSGGKDAATGEMVNRRKVNFSLSEAYEGIPNVGSSQGPEITSSVDTSAASRDHETVGSSGLVWLRGGSVFEIVSVYATVRHFCDEAAGLATAGAMGEEREGTLRDFLEKFVRQVFLPQFESRCFYRLSNILSAPDAWKRDMQSEAGSSGAGDSGGRSSSIAILSSAAEVDAMLQEVVGLCAALDDYETELLNIGLSLIKSYLQAATGVLHNLLEKSSTETMIGRQDILAVLRTDPLYTAIFGSRGSLSPTRRPQFDRARDVDFSTCDPEELEAFFVLEHLKCDALLLGANILSQYSAGAALTELVTSWTLQAQKRGEGVEALSDIGKLHHSLQWLANRSHSRCVQVMDVGCVALDALAAGKQYEGRRLFSRAAGRRGSTEDTSETSERESALSRIAQVLRAAGTLSRDGHCLLPQEFGIRLSEIMVECEELCRDGADKLLLGLRQQLRFHIASQMGLLLQLTLMPTHGMPKADRCGDAMRRVIVAAESAIQRSLTPPLRTYVMAYIPRLIYVLLVECVTAIPPNHKPDVTALLDGLVMIATAFKSFEALNSAPPALQPQKWIKSAQQYVQLLLVKGPELLQFVGQNPRLFTLHEYQAVMAAVCEGDQRTHNLRSLQAVLSAALSSASSMSASAAPPPRPARQRK